MSFNIMTNTSTEAPECICKVSFKIIYTLVVQKPWSFIFLYYSSISEIVQQAWSLEINFRSLKSAVDFENLIVWGKCLGGSWHLYFQGDAHFRLWCPSFSWLKLQLKLPSECVRWVTLFILGAIRSPNNTFFYYSSIAEIVQQASSLEKNL